MIKSNPAVNTAQLPCQLLWDRLVRHSSASSAGPAAGSYSSIQKLVIVLPNLKTGDFADTDVLLVRQRENSLENST